ncbi:hypothetical protein [Gulbenkiania mobilis]|uniref:hypothetical protein n=1 Tax=Gulbenkiania mobilis TaxID=397457 RepID=UPI00128F3620|nr:hypothetical protein [Gulbenkiania mobilis]
MVGKSTRVQRSKVPGIIVEPAKQAIKSARRGEATKRDVSSLFMVSAIAKIAIDSGLNLTPPGQDYLRVQSVLQNGLTRSEPVFIECAEFDRAFSWLQKVESEFSRMADETMLDLIDRATIKVGFIKVYGDEHMESCQ